ncbi:MAG TPA: glycoside hydrolase family 2 TIM barrel-domain containing protein [Propionibacteriaceae bacterium]|nr:glycoside hydrolase family 2 TIM barrel-domain containing protein [Propionibacteriaceae bacterium]
MISVAESHPRPQLTRPDWTDLCGPWQFAYDDAEVGLDDGWNERDDVFDRVITVPFPPESPASGIGEPSFHPVVWYRRTFLATREAGKRLLLHFGAVDYRASVWVNGRLVVEHEGGHTPFQADITAALSESGDQVVTVRAEDRPRDVTQPRGKQDWVERPHKIFYERTTGIWQPVWLEPVPATHVASVRWATDLSRGVLATRIVLTGPLTAGLRLRLRLSLKGATLADDTYTADASVVQRDIPLDRVAISYDRPEYLWSPNHPNLVDVTVTVLDGDAVVDEVGSYVGLRSVACSGGRFLLNNRPFFLRMVLAQNYWPESHLAAPSAEAIREEVAWVKRLGFNGARIHQKIEDPRFLYWCDRLGVLAWGELPSALVFDTVTLGRLTREWLEVLERDAAAPSIVAWVPFNESWGVPSLEADRAQRDAVRALYYLTRAVDPTRPVIGNDGWEHLVSDIFGVHDYSASGALLRERYGSAEALQRTLTKVQPYYRNLVLPERVGDEAPLMVTEFGGITYDPESDEFWNGYGAVQTAPELLERYGELVTALLDSPVVTGFCYTQLTDTAQERNGLLDEHRRPKVEAEALAAINRRPSASVPADAIAEIQIAHAARRSAGEP